MGCGDRGAVADGLGGVLVGGGGGVVRSVDLSTNIISTQDLPRSMIFILTDVLLSWHP